MADRITLQVARYRPEQDAEPSFQEYEVPCPQGLGRPRRAQLHQGSTRRDAVVPVVVPDGHLRQLRHDRQRRAEADLRHVPHRLRARAGARRAAANFPVIRDLIVEIGDFMRKLQRGQALDHPRRGEAAVGGRVPADAGGARGIQAVQHVHQLHAVLRRLPGLRARSEVHRAGRHRPGPALQPRSRDQGAQERLRDPLRSTRASGAAPSSGECTKVCPKHVDPAGAIQRYKLDASVEWLKSFFMPRGAR